jgi:hypothetical protein
VPVSSTRSSFSRPTQLPSNAVETASSHSVSGFGILSHMLANSATAGFHPSAVRVSRIA